MYSPFVYWGQTESTLTLRVDLKKAENPLIELTDSKLSFSGSGYGARGQNQYLFHIDFYEEIDPEASTYKVIDRDIAFVLRKKQILIWPRLLQQTVKPPWLKVDFDKMQTDDLTDDNDDLNDIYCDDENSGYFDPNVDEWKRKPNLFRDIGRKGRSNGRTKRPKLTPEEFRKVYLFLYNLFQCVGSAYILLILVIGYAKDGTQSEERYLDYLYPLLAPALRVIQLLKILEVIHPLLSFTTGDVLYPLMTSLFRLFILFFVIEPFENIQDRPVVRNILTIWTVSDIIRHSYYMMRTFKVETFITWIYYTSWMVLYPVEFLCIGVLILIVIPMYDESEKYSLSLPNSANVSFSLAAVLRIFSLIGFFPVFTMFFMRMYKKRKYRLHSWKKSYKNS